MVSWEELIQKFKDAKKQKKTGGLSMPAITSLLFSGAFDEMLPPTDGPKYLNYLTLNEEIKKALGSKASLPPKKKDDIIGLSDVASDAHLQIWRHQINPTISFSFVGQCKRVLEANKYYLVDRGSTEAIKRHFDNNNKETIQTWLVGDWSKIPDDDSHPFVRDLLGSRKRLGAVGVVTDVTKSSFEYNGTKKEMLRVKMFNGYGYINDLVVWSEKSGKVSEKFKDDLKKGSMCILDISVSINKKNNKRSYAIVDSHSFQDA